MKRIRSVLTKWLITTITISGLFLLAGCQGKFDVSSVLNQLVTQFVGQPTATPQSTSEPTAEVISPLVTPTSPTISGTIELTIWVPPQFDPSAETPQAELFKRRIKEFEELHDDVFITVRVKAATGSNGLLESLVITNQAAMQAMPSLVAFSRADVETAVEKNLVKPLDNFSSEIDQNDWYSYALNMSTKEGNTYGLPFAGNALVLVYRDSGSAQPPETWNDILRRGEPISFPGGDPHSMMTFAMYLTNGGDLETIQRLPKLDIDNLTQIYQTYADGASSGVFPLWITQFQSDTDAWTSYNELRSNHVITWLSRFLSESSLDSRIMVFPSYTEIPVSLADGWVWSLTDPRPETHQLVADLAEFLVDPDYLKLWTPEAGYLPVRPSSVEGFGDQAIRAAIEQIAASSRLKPSNEIVNEIGPEMRDQLVQVLSLKTTAPFAAQAIIDSINNY